MPKLTTITATTASPCAVFVQKFIPLIINFNNMEDFRLSKSQLLLDLNYALDLAIKHKKSKDCVVNYLKNRDENLKQLCESLWSRTWKASTSTCFIITHPKMREVFAASFVDRIVHHLYFNYCHDMFERLFISDCYSCIKNRGNLYGAERMEKHIKSESNNWKEKAYILKLDIKGYFMNINRNILLDIAIKKLNKLRNRTVAKNSDIEWRNIKDFDFIEYLTKEIILIDVTKNCKVISNPKEYEGLPDSKTLFKSTEGCGLPIGNLTSQLYSNVYLNELDQFCKRELKCKHYGRYVDDFYIVSKDKKFLRDCIWEIEKFLDEKLHLKLQHGKIIITDSNKGVEFLGVYLKPFRRYVSNQCVRRTNDSLNKALKTNNLDKIYSSINSILGVYSHNNSFNKRCDKFLDIDISEIGVYNDTVSKIIKNKNEINKDELINDMDLPF